MKAECDQGLSSLKIDKEHHKSLLKPFNTFAFCYSLNTFCFAFGLKCNLTNPNQAYWRNVPVATFLQNDMLLLARFTQLSK